MTARNSSEQGYLPPGPGLFRFQFDMPDGWDTGYWDPVPPLDGQDLDDFMQQLVAGITRLDPTLVRPRWQPEPPNMPDFNTNWAAIGITSTEPDPGWAYARHDSLNEGRNYMQQHEIVALLVSCYGPKADYYSGLLRNGLQVPQNREILQLTAMGLMTVGGARVVPEFIKQRWLRRIDREVRIHRMIRDVYPVLSIKSVPVSINAASPGDTILTENRTVVAP